MNLGSVLGMEKHDSSLWEEEEIAQGSISPTQGETIPGQNGSLLPFQNGAMVLIPVGLIQQASPFLTIFPEPSKLSVPTVPPVPLTHAVTHTTDTNPERRKTFDYLIEEYYKEREEKQKYVRVKPHSSKEPVAFVTIRHIVTLLKELNDKTILELLNGGKNGKRNLEAFVQKVQESHVKTISSSILYNRLHSKNINIYINEFDLPEDKKDLYKQVMDMLRKHANNLYAKSCKKADTREIFTSRATSSLPISSLLNSTEDDFHPCGETDSLDKNPDFFRAGKFEVVDIASSDDEKKRSEESDEETFEFVNDEEDSPIPGVGKEFTDSDIQKLREKFLVIR